MGGGGLLERGLISFFHSKGGLIREGGLFGGGLIWGGGLNREIMTINQEIRQLLRQSINKVVMKVVSK